MKRHHCNQLFIAGLLLFIAASGLSAQKTVTIHLIHPWANDPQRVVNPPYIITSETGWYPGLPMSSEGGNWYTYTFTRLNRTTNDRMEFASYIPTQFNDYDGGVKYPTGSQLIFVTIFKDVPEDVNEVWITPAAGGGAPKLSFTPPPGGKVISVLNPWNLGAPRIRIGDYGTVVMKPDRRSDRCGWFFYHFYGVIDSTVKVLFMNSLDSTLYGQTGFTGAQPISVQPVLAKNDSVWIHAKIEGDSSAVVSSVFPGVKGLCRRTIDLAVTMRDIGTHPDFDIYNALADIQCAGLQRGMVQNKLGANGKPVKKAHKCTTLHTQFDWFDTKTLTGGYTNEICYNLTLTTNDDGIYEYDTAEFFPIDSFVYLDPARTIRNPNNEIYMDPNNPKTNNIHFTMELSAQFEYHKGQAFYFRGDDDVWVFIDSQLVVDLGGVHGPEEGAVNLDTLGLTQGATYSFKLFFTERNCCGSNFLMQTSINLTTSTRMFWIKSIPAAGQMQYDIFERLSRSNLSCNPVEGDVDTVDAAAVFSIEGPQFPQPQQLPGGRSYGGIYISTDNNVLTLDTTAMTGLETGYYTITFQLMSDPTQRGQVSFVIFNQPKPELVQNPVVTAAYFADNGNGQVTRAEVYFTNPLVKMPDSVVLYWPEPVGSKRRVVTGAGLIPAAGNPRHITAVPAQPFDSFITRFKGTAGLGTSFIHDTTFSQPNDVARFDINDSVGPLLMSAHMPERTGAGPDTFYLTFSETVDEKTLTGASLLLKTPDGTELPLTIRSYRLWSDTLIVLTEPTAHIPVAGDSLRIAPQGNITDKFTNHAHPLNRPVPVLIRKAPPKVIGAWYTDRNADGMVDEAVFSFDRPVDLDECTVTINWLGSITAANLSGARLAYRSADSTLVRINLATAFSGAVPVATSGLMSYKLDLQTSLLTTQSGTCTDSAAPVLILAEFHPAVFDSMVTPPDTLKITLSEPVQSIISATPFIISKPSGSSVTIPQLQQVQHQGAIAVFIVTTPLAGNSYPAEGDSIHINPAAGIADVNGAVQNNPDNRRVQLKVLTVTPHFIVTAGPNPFDPGSESFAIRINPSVRGRGQFLYRVHLTIYDKVGSLVTQKEWPETAPGYSTTETVYWNGINRRGRMVGSGTYLGTVVLTGDKGTQLEAGRKHRLKIGVTRR